ncbi:RlmE family RNA methyltransferase [Pelagibacteraceae bacterium]|nr:RlmE family RNA methyltransferase [Pelagibacteraceae bacterium]
MKIKNKSFKDKNKKWLKRHVDDEFVQKSISDNYRSRAAYKLVEIIEKYKILNEAKNVIDLGSAPGSWCQILKNYGKSLNSIIAVDILEMEEIKGVTFYRSDFLSSEFEKISKTIGEFDLVLSDISPNLSGNKVSDFLLSKDLVENALSYSLQNLNTNGHFVAKYFRTGDISDVLTICKRNFHKVTSFKPKSSRKNSSEIYLVCLRKK